MRYKISTDFYDGKNIYEEHYGTCTEEDKELLVERLTKLGYEKRKNRYSISLPCPPWDHHGDYSLTYYIVPEKELKRTQIEKIIADVIDPKKWVDDFDDEEVDETEDLIK